MVEEKSPEDCTRKRIKQTISVPFLWEVKPGTPKREWKQSILPDKPPPIKLIASVPFQWEEKPGKPFPPNNISSMLSPPRCLEQNYSSSDSYHNGEDEQEEMSELGFETTDEFFSSGRSLLANCLVPTTAISNALPVQEFSLLDCNYSGYIQAPSSPAWETDSSTSSYATGTTSLVGDSFLQCMFPLLTPKSSFPKKVGCSEEGEFSHSPGKASRKDFDLESVCSAVGRKVLTLGELIMMSRRSSQRKAVQMRNQNLSMEFMKGNAIGCCIRIGGLQKKWKRQLQVKLI